MAKPSVTITLSKSKPPAQDNAATNQKNEAQNELTNGNADVPKSTLPKNKRELLERFFTQALPINNKVQPTELKAVNEQRVMLYRQQQERIGQMFTAPTHLRPTYPAHQLKSNFIEYQRYLEVINLDQRSVIDFSSLEVMWQQIHIIDDLLSDVLRHMPAQRPVGWQVTSMGKNHLKLPTVGRLKDRDQVADQSSLNSYVLGHFGVMSYTFDRAFFIGHVLGYLFCCYYLSHLSISYGVTPLPNAAVKNYDYASLDTGKLVRLLQTVDAHCKRRIYQLAIFCARLSHYKLDKYVEKILIKEVNEFNKKQQIGHLDKLIHTGIMPDMRFDDDTDDK